MLSPRNPQYTAGIFIEQSLTRRALSTRRCNEQTVQLLNVGSRVPVHRTAMGLSYLAKMDPVARRSTVLWSSGLCGGRRCRCNAPTEQKSLVHCCRSGRHHSKRSPFAGGAY